MAILGIDLGTTNSLACVYRNQKVVFIPNTFQEYLTPSVVSIDDEGCIIVGKLAKERLITHPDRTIANFKRYMGSEKKLILANKSFAPEELSSFILRKLIEDATVYLQEEIEEIIVSVPAYFDDNQRWATKTAGMLAGVKAERIINEPSAAALTLQEGWNKERTYMVVDFGGGTLDISIVDAFDNVIEILAVAGDNHLGGEDFNQAIMQDFLDYHQLDANMLSKDEKQLLYKQAEACKIKMNDQNCANIQLTMRGTLYTYELALDRFNKITRSLLLRINDPVHKVLRDAQSKIDDIDDVILVGGSCKMLIVKEYIREIIKKDVVMEADPDYAIAYGCGIVAGIKERQEDIRDVLLTDICPMTLGTNILENTFSPIIERNTILPCSREKLFSTLRLGQKKMIIEIYQGESIKSSENMKLGEFDIDVPYNTKEYETCSVRFTYDINGLLEVDVMVLSTKRQWHEVIISKRNRMSHEQIDKRLKELAELKIHPRDSEQNALLLERANRLFKEVIGIKRDQLQDWYIYFNKVLDKQEERLIKETYKEFKHFLDQLEGIAPDDRIPIKGYMS